MPRAARPSSRTRDIDDLLEGGSRRQVLEPAREVRVRRPLDRQAHPELHVAAERDVADGQALPSEARTPRERLIGNRQDFFTASRTAFMSRFSGGVRASAQNTGR